MTELQSKAIQRIDEVYCQAELIYNHSFVRPTINFELRGSRAGYAIYSRNLISLNNNLLHEYGEKFIQEIPGHEAAHLIARTMYPFGISSHGREWKMVMERVCNQQAKRCHSFDVKTKNEYVCGCNGRVHYLSTIKHNRIIRGATSFMCLDCKKTLSWKKLVF